MRTVLQVPMTINLKQQAASVAKDLGFSSLQEAVRLLLNRLAAGHITISVNEVVQLSAKNEKRYRAMDADFAHGKNFKQASSVDELMRQLHDHPAA